MTAPSTYLRQLREGAANRRLELAKILRDTPEATNLELAAALNVNRDTIAEDRKFLMVQANQETKTEIQLYRDNQLTRIEEKWDEIEADASMTGAEKHLAWSRWMKLEMDLRGTAAPAKSLVGHVHDAENLGPYRKFVLAVRGLDESQIEELLTAARAVPRKIRPMPQPPKTSPLWTNQLGDGHVSS